MEPIGCEVVFLSCVVGALQPVTYIRIEREQSINFDLSSELFSAFKV